MVDNKFCRSCGASIPQESKFCLKCGATLTSTPTAERQIEDFPRSQQQESPAHETYNPSYYPQQRVSPSGLGPSFWLAFVGGVFGILGGVVALFVGSFSESFSGYSGDYYWLGLGAIVFSVMGIMGGVFEKKPKVGGTLMIVSAIGILISISLFGVLSCILFLVGGILIFARSRR
jgi:zinc-ribbon domain